MRDFPAGAEFTTNFRELREREADLENRTIAASTYRATEFEGTPPGIVLRGIDFRP